MPEDKKQDDVYKLNDGTQVGRILYEDDIGIAVLPDKPAVLGHIKIFPKKQFDFLKDMPDDDATHLFFMASYAATAVFEYFGAEGTNIIVDEGTFKDEPICFNVLPRKFDDGMSFQWEPGSFSEADKEQAFSQLKDKAFYIGKETAEEKKPALTTESVIPNEKGKKQEPVKEEDYKVRHLRRIP